MNISLNMLSYTCDGILETIKMLERERGSSLAKELVKKIGDKEKSNRNYKRFAFGYRISC